MRFGLYEIVLLKEDSRVLGEKTIDNKTYAIAEPGKEYSVKVNIYRDPITGLFPYQYVRIGLFVDGCDVQYWKRIDFSDETILPKDKSLPVTSKFWGFKENTEDLKSFVFALPKASSDENDISQQKPLGSVKAIFHDAVVTTGMFDNQIVAKEAPSQQNVSDGQKFWQQASVGTVAGSQVARGKEQFNALPKWSNRNRDPDHSLTLFYHTPEMLHTLEMLTNDGVNTNPTNATNVSSAGTGNKRKLRVVEQEGSGSAKRPVVFDLTHSSDEEEAAGGNVDYDTEDDWTSALPSAAASVNIRGSAASSGSISNMGENEDAAVGVTREILIDEDISLVVMPPKAYECMVLGDDEDEEPQWTTIVPQLQQQHNTGSNNSVIGSSSSSSSSSSGGSFVAV